ncbi:MAG TPA: Flp family type IVb pilin [Terriglobales bacterium]|jgi:pilus assembly protein Flp/PilA|nr:Flp family type IVb pilin [Terriglobales bacterium]
MTEVLRRFWIEDEGQDLVEYALIVALVSVALIAALTALKGGISTAFSQATSAL